MHKARLFSGFAGHGIKVGRKRLTLDAAVLKKATGSMDHEDGAAGLMQGLAHCQESVCGLLMIAEEQQGGIVLALSVWIGSRWENAIHLEHFLLQAV